MIITPEEFRTLAAIAFRLTADGSPAYPGYTPGTVEAPNGDGRLDTGKRYAHIARKYINQTQRRGNCSYFELFALCEALDRCHAEAIRVHAALGLPEAWAPDLDASALRILEYPPGATSARHTDFDLFTLVCYRDPYPGGLVREPVVCPWCQGDGAIVGPELEGCWRCKGSGSADAISPGIHFGELYELGGFGRATPHEVRAAVYDDGAEAVCVWQYSAVYFCLPKHSLVLPDGRKVGPQTEPGTYLHERMGRSRVAR